MHGHPTIKMTPCRVIEDQSSPGLADVQVEVFRYLRYLEAVKSLVQLHQIENCL